MKKITAIIMGICMLGTIVLSGCGSDSTTESDNVGNNNGNSSAENTASQETDNRQKGYVFEVNGVKISVDTEVTSVIEALGEPDSYFEEPSCAAQGIAKLYTYSSFEIDTYPDGDQDLIACIILKDDNVATAEGVDLSMTKDKVIEVYGDGYTESEGKLTYEKDGMKLCFILDGEYIKSIEYDSAVLN